MPPTQTTAARMCKARARVVSSMGCSFFPALGRVATRVAVMAGLVPAIHVLLPVGGQKTWMPGIKPGMTAERAFDNNTPHAHRHSRRRDGRALSFLSDQTPPAGRRRHVN